MADSAAPSTTKAALRGQFRQQRLHLLPTAEPALQSSARRQLPPLLRGGGLLGLYWPLAGEADLRGLAELPALQQRLALPRVRNGALEYCRWQPGAALVADATGIPAPPGSATSLQPEAMALLLAPALAFDRRGVRLGYGGGWFDRLRCQPHWRRVKALAVLPAGCLLPQLPSDPWDVPFDGWLDEQGLHWLQAV